MSLHLFSPGVWGSKDWLLPKRLLLREAHGDALGSGFSGLLEVSRHPTQLYSSVLALLIFAVTLWLFYRRRFTGQVFLAYLMLYAVSRSLVEIFRENLLVWGPITIAQLVSFGLFLVALLCYIYRRRQAEAAVLPEHGEEE